MRKMLVVAIVAVIGLAAAYLAGYMPERGQRLAAQEEAEALRARAAAAEARLRTGALLGEALTVKEVAMRQDYGQAREMSSRFFDAVRNEASSAPDGSVREALNQVLSQRDAVTAALAKGEPAVVETLRGIEMRLRRALGYPLPPEPPAPAPPEPEAVPGTGQPPATVPGAGPPPVTVPGAGPPPVSQP